MNMGCVRQRHIQKNIKGFVLPNTRAKKMYPYKKSSIKAHQSDVHKNHVLPKERMMDEAEGQYLEPLEKLPIMASGTMVDIGTLSLAVLSENPHAMYTEGNKLLHNMHSGLSTLEDKAKTKFDQLKLASETIIPSIISKIIEGMMMNVAPCWNSTALAMKLVMGTSAGLAMNQIMSKVVIPKAMGKKIEDIKINPKEIFNNKDFFKKLIAASISLATMMGAIIMRGTELIANKSLNPPDMAASSENALSGLVNQSKKIFNKKKGFKDIMPIVAKTATKIATNSAGEIVVGQLFHNLKQRPMIGVPVIVMASFLAHHILCAMPGLLPNQEGK